MNLIQLRNGPLVREDAVLLALSLEDAGHVLSTRGSSLDVSNAKALSIAHRHALSQPNLVRHVVALVAYGQTVPEPICEVIS